MATEIKPFLVYDKHIKYIGEIPKIKEVENVSRAISLIASSNEIKQQS